MCHSVIFFFFLSIEKQKTNTLFFLTIYDTIKSKLNDLNKKKKNNNKNANQQENNNKIVSKNRCPDTQYKRPCAKSKHATLFHSHERPHFKRVCIWFENQTTHGKEYGTMKSIKWNLLPAEIVLPMFYYYWVITFMNGLTCFKDILCSNIAVEKRNKI